MALSRYCHLLVGFSFLLVIVYNLARFLQLTTVAFINKTDSELLS